MIKIKNFDRYAITLHQTLGLVLDVINTTDNERIKNYMKAVSHYLCMDVYHVASVRVMSAINKCRKIDEYDDLLLLVSINYSELIDLMEFTED